MLARMLLFSALSVLASARQTADSDLLADSELVYDVSGGIQGIVRSAKLVAKSGSVTAVYTANDERLPGGRLEGPREPAPYLELWAEAEREGIWTLEIPGKEEGADLMYHTLTARVGERRHSVSWTGLEPSLSVQKAVRIADRILALARETAAER